MGLDPNSRARFNLKDANVLLLDSNQLGMSILVQIVTGLGAKSLFRCGEVAEAQLVAQSNQLDLAIVDSLAPTGEGYDFVKWLRREGGEPNCYTPVLITTSHTPASQISLARDCGAHIIIKKPFPPITVLERIIWASKEGRKFLFSDTYVGPDRRFRDLGPPKGEKGRRRDDQAGAGATGNSADIDSVATALVAAATADASGATEPDGNS